MFYMSENDSRFSAKNVLMIIFEPIKARFIALGIISARQNITMKIMNYHNHYAKKNKL